MNSLDSWVGYRSTAARRFARSAYEALEPLHVVAYFNPSIRSQCRNTGLSPMARYLAGRGAPLGNVSGASVAAMFYNFNPSAVAPAWAEAKAYGLHRTFAMHLDAIEQTLDAAFGPLVEHPALTQLADRFVQIGGNLNYAGRPLAAAWATTLTTEASHPPHLRLWLALAPLREFRGDGHVAALVQAGLSDVESVVFHESPHPDPSLRRRTLGTAFARTSRAWSEQEWTMAQSSLGARNLLDSDATISTSGCRLYAALEDTTDDMASGVFEGVPDAGELVSGCRPFVKAVIDAGVLPGTVSRA